MISTGLTALTTTGQQTITLLNSLSPFATIVLINEGPTAGFFSVDGGSSWARMPAAAAATSPVVITIQNTFNEVNLQVQGNNLSGLWAWAK
jgi:hypothetical protein